jgi:hypothetical protein
MYGIAKDIKHVAAAQQRMRREPELASARKTLQDAKRRLSVSGRNLKTDH